MNDVTRAAAIAAAVTGVFAFASFSYWLLGLGALETLVQIGSLLVPFVAGAVAGLITAKPRLLFASGVGAVAGVALAWFGSAAVSPRELGDLWFVAWAVIGVVAGFGHVAGAVLAPRRYRPNPGRSR